MYSLVGPCLADSVRRPVGARERAERVTRAEEAATRKYKARELAKHWGFLFQRWNKHPQYFQSFLVFRRRCKQQDAARNARLTRAAAFALALGAGQRAKLLREGRTASFYSFLYLYVFYCVSVSFSFLSRRLFLPQRGSVSVRSSSREERTGAYGGRSGARGLRVARSGTWRTYGVGLQQALKLTRNSISAGHLWPSPQRNSQKLGSRFWQMTSASRRGSASQKSEPRISIGETSAILGPPKKGG